MPHQLNGQRRMISGHFALMLLRDIGIALDGVVAPRVPGDAEIQAAADQALLSAIEGHDVRNWDSEPADVKSELARRWLALAAECGSFGEASMLSLPWGTADRVIRNMLLEQLLQTPRVSGSIAA